MRRFVTMVAAAGMVCGAAMTFGNSEAQAQVIVRPYGYQFCAIQYYDSHRDCRYVTWDQCQMTASPNGYCIENPAYVAARASGPVRY